MTTRLYKETAMIAFSTCSKRIGGVDYFRSTVKSMIADGGFFNVPPENIAGCFAIHDGPLPRRMVNHISEMDLETGRWFTCIIEGADKNVGDRQNLWRVFRRALRDKTWDRLIYFEDDIRFLGKNALLRMLTIPILEDEGFASFHDMKELTEDSPFGLYHYSVSGWAGTGLWGLQAMVFPRHVVEYLAGKDCLVPFAHDPRKKCDRVVEHYLLESPWPFQSVHSPSLVQHVGFVSAATPGIAMTHRQTKREAPPDFDAALLIGAEEKRFP